MFLEDNDDDLNACGCGEEDCEECGEKIEKDEEEDGDDDYGDGDVE